MKTINGKVGIIIVNYKSYEDTYECLQSIQEIDYPDFSVYVVDNGSNDGSLEKIQILTKKFPFPLIVIGESQNLGFAGGNNIGIKQAVKDNCNYFWLLNNDTIVLPNSLSPLVKTINTGNKVGIVGSKIYYNNSNKIWFAGGQINSLTLETSHIGMNVTDNGMYDKEKEVGYITGCSLLFEKNLLNDIGFMEEDYFLYYEETDWNIRARNAGWIIKYAPESVIYHKVSASSTTGNQLSPYVDYYFLRNHYVLCKKFQKRYLSFISLPYLIWKFVKKVIKVYVKCNRETRKERIWYLKAGFLDGIYRRMGKHPIYTK
ncbi:glycosyltransferase family 2 protein [Niallia sp. FSL K6-0077]|uniref:glycosyltransferase family 2 protein n=1 Tax=Niallia sp. FSL K6-0077 TaxID=2954743 RepID=UPI0030F750E3